MSELSEELREYTAMKYAGNCKCGKCQLVPRELIDRILPALRDHAPTSKQPAWPKEEIGLGQFADVDPAVLGPALVLDIEEKYLLGHFDEHSACDIMPGDVQGSFHRIREALAGHQQSAASTVEPAALNTAQQIARDVCRKAKGISDGLPAGDPEKLRWLHHSYGADEVAYLLDGHIDAAATTTPEPPFDLAAFQKEAATWETVESEATCKDSLQVQSSPEPDAVREALVDELLREAKGRSKPSLVGNLLERAAAALSAPVAGDETPAYQACRAVWEDIETCATAAEMDDWKSKELSGETLEALIKVLQPEWDRRRALARNQRVTSQPDTGEDFSVGVERIMQVKP